MSTQTSALNFNPTLAIVGNWRSRVLAIFLIVAIAGIFWVDSRYPALLKRYHAGTQLKATGALTFGAVYQVDRSMPLATRVWRTTVNWLDANRIGMTFSSSLVPPRSRFSPRFLAAGFVRVISTRSSAPPPEFHLPSAPIALRPSPVDSSLPA